MSFVVRNLFLGLAFLFLGCQQPAVTVISVEHALQRIENVDVDLGHYPSYSEYHHRVYRQEDDVVRQISSVSELKTLFLECNQRWKSAPEMPQERLQWVDPHCEAQNAILFRLADINSGEATKVLIDLYADETLGWDGEFSLNAGNAISRCGSKALPHLAKLQLGARKGAIQRIMSCIEKGERYGP